MRFEILRYVISNVFQEDNGLILLRKIIGILNYVVILVLDTEQGQTEKQV